MRIVEIREKTVSMASAIANAYIDFSKMTCSVVALITDVVRNGKPVVGYGFNSNGRYGQGSLMRERLLPRLMAADPKTLVDETDENLDPSRIWRTLMTNEKPGGHGERSVAVGTIDMAVWDAVAKIAGKPLYQLLADRYRGGKADRKVWVYAAALFLFLPESVRPHGIDMSIQDRRSMRGVAGALRVFCYTMVVSFVGAIVAAGSVYADFKEGSLRVGRELETLNNVVGPAGEHGVRQWRRRARRNGFHSAGSRRGPRSVRGRVPYASAVHGAGTRGYPGHASREDARTP